MKEDHSSQEDSQKSFLFDISVNYDISMLCWNLLPLLKRSATRPVFAL